MEPNKVVQLRGMRRPEKVKAPRYRPFQNKIIQLDDVKKLTPDDTWNFMRRMGWIDGNTLYENYAKKIKGVWQNEPCYIIGSGPPLKDTLEAVGWDFFDNKHTIGINHIIEDYDNVEWLFFLDKRFIAKTTYNLNEFPGHIFAQNNTGMKPAENVTLYMCNNSKPSTDLRNGLYSPNFSGLAALNLAIIAGADPIYLIGFGNGKSASHLNYHYRKDYNGEVKKKKIFTKYCNVYAFFEKFGKWKDRVIHVTDGDDIPVFDKMRTEDFKRHAERARHIEITRQPEIVHFSFSDDIKQHADVTRNIIDGCYGNHTLVNQKTEMIPPADLYVLEHFQSTDRFVKAFPYPKKAIDIVHTVGCIPHNNFKKVIALTKAWKRYLQNHLVENVDIMHIGIDLEPYEEITPRFENKTFGRITRWSASKIHPRWNNICLQVLNAIPDSKSLIYTQLDQTGQRNPLAHDRALYNKNCTIDMFKGDFLKNLSVYVHANGSFIDTFSHGVLEGMATGLPVIILDDKVGAVKEVAGDAGIICRSIEEVRDKIKILLTDRDLWLEYSALSKQRARYFNKKRMIRKFNGVIKECLRK